MGAFILSEMLRIKTHSPHKTHESTWSRDKYDARGLESKRSMVINRVLALSAEGGAPIGGSFATLGGLDQPRTGEMQTDLDSINKA